MRIRGLASLAALCIFGGCAYASPLVGGATANDIAKIMQAKGLTATISTDKYGDPLIASKYKELSWFVQFYDCKAGRCGAIQFAIAYDLSSGTALVTANEWNKKKRWGRLYLDEENDPSIQMDMNLARGATTEAVEDDLDVWFEVVDSFKTFVETGEVTSKYQ